MWTCASCAPPTLELDEEVKSGNFREDLLFRINTVEIHLPPLRDRREDIPLLAAHFLNRNRARYRKQVSGFSARCYAATDALPVAGERTRA